MTYCKVKLPKSPAGLGNKFFPWARCRIFSHLSGVPMLAPRWSQLALGCLLRGKPRSYLDIFLPGENDVRGSKRLWAESFCEKKTEPHDWSKKENDWYQALYIFEGDKDFFARLHPFRDFLYQELLSIVHPIYRKESESIPDPAIALHVRLGDFRVAPNPESFLTTGGLRTPLSWFASSLRMIRKKAGINYPAFIFSDGSNSDLKELLCEPNVTRISTKNAITDFLTLSRSKVLLASGGSTFSAWAAFFGQMPVVTIPGQSLDWYKLRATPQCFRGVFDPQDPNPIFLENACNALKQRPSHEPIVTLQNNTTFPERVLR